MTHRTTPPVMVGAKRLAEKEQVHQENDGNKRQKVAYQRGLFFARIFEQVSKPMRLVELEKEYVHLFTLLQAHAARQTMGMEMVTICGLPGTGKSALVQTAIATLRGSNAIETLSFERWSSFNGHVVSISDPSRPFILIVEEASRFPIADLAKLIQPLRNHPKGVFIIACSHAPWTIVAGPLVSYFSVIHKGIILGPVPYARKVALVANALTLSDTIIMRLEELKVASINDMKAYNESILMSLSCPEELRSFFDGIEDMHHLMSIVTDVVVPFKSLQRIPFLTAHHWRTAFEHRRMSKSLHTSMDHLLRLRTDPHLVLLITIYHLEMQKINVYNFQMCWKHWTCVKQRDGSGEMNLWPDIGESAMLNAWKGLCNDDCVLSPPNPPKSGFKAVMMGVIRPDMRLDSSASQGPQYDDEGRPIIKAPSSQLVLAAQARQIGTKQREQKSGWSSHDVDIFPSMDFLPNAHDLSARFSLRKLTFDPFLISLRLQQSPQSNQSTYLISYLSAAPL